jgi:LuxR family maltose regulon positive regulatory protein
METGNTTFMPVIQSLQAELALRQGQVTAVGRWAGQLGSIPPLTPIWGFFSLHLTLVRVWLAQGTGEGLERAAGMLAEVRQFVEATHNTRFLIESLAVEALLHSAEGDEPAALSTLEKAISLAEPGGFIRLFVDIGPGLAPLLRRLRVQGLAVDYVNQVLGAFGTEDKERVEDSEDSSIVHRPSSPLVEQLTPRESEVLALLARHMTNKEIADELVVSPSTIKTHTLNIYGKLGVHSRREAVARARELWASRIVE